MSTTSFGNEAPETAAPVAPPTRDTPLSLLEQLCEVKRRLVLEEMASGFAHEVNQPIAAIATFAQAAERMLTRPEPAVSEAAKAMRHVAEQALSAGHEIRRIRSLFTTTGESREVCQIDDIVAQLLPLLQARARSERVKLECTVREGLPRVSVARLRIQQVLLSLVRNAIDASREAPQAAVRIDVSGDKYAVLTAVADSGRGVAKEERRQLFSPFFTTKIGGSGLDLACSRATIEAHGGKIGFDDTVTEGAKFWFSLPAVSEAA
jgi:C4-dicarboxylate-specific signal transduction histidine kinase